MIEITRVRQIFGFLVHRDYLLPVTQHLVQRCKLDIQVSYEMNEVLAGRELIAVSVAMKEDDLVSLGVLDHAE